MAHDIKAADLQNMIGIALEPSPWFKISQERVNLFVDAINDHQFIHVNPKKAQATQFGGPIAHSFLTLSLLTYPN